MSEQPDDAQYITGRIVTNGTVIDDGLLAFRRGRIVYCGPAADFFESRGANGVPDGGAGGLPDGGAVRDNAFAPASEFVHSVSLPPGSMILPGLVDMHCHGAHGGDFPSGDEEQARGAIDFLHRSGTTSLLASMVTASHPDLLHGVRTLRRLAAEGLLAGIHLEGPFLSHSRCGAQNPRWLTDPDLEFTARLLDAAGGTISTMTYAPELPGANDLVAALASSGVVPSLGHTDCDADTAASALESAEAALAGHMEAPAAGSGPVRRPTATHLFNGMPPAHHRLPGPVPVCLRAAKAGRAVVELIADNIHLAPQTVLSVFELAGAANVALVSDSMAAAGLSDGQYWLGPSEITVSDGVATLAGGSIAGGTATLLQVLQRTVEAGVPLPDAVTAATEVPAGVIGCGNDVGRLQAGYRADALIVSDSWQLQHVLRNGQWLKQLPSNTPG
ncbi:N-acetylglucosamine-6-phosphate deacetylase [Arthrobacter castelli]|uniref:N-acetylglucosamine-6-phosphate deacetylase n=1 Tax=Arthrobacter castelli TaxID=271431 RepID=UPI0003FDAF2E|nr:amidohydrolase family protein [Arthrobacter castelli]